MKAFPCKAYVQDKTGIIGISEYSGMDLRDYFAAQAMQAFCSRSDTPLAFDALITAKNAYKMADAMMEARKK